MPIAPPRVTATRVHVENLDTGEVCYTKGNGSTEPASLIKLLSILVLRERKPTLASLDRTTTIVAADLVGGSGANLLAGDVVSLHGLLLDALLPSSNAASQAIARCIGQELLDADTAGAGDPVARFVAEMNKQAARLGMSSTLAVDAHGTSLANRSTAADICRALGALRGDEVVLNAWRFKRALIPLVRGNDSTLLSASFSLRMCADVGIIGGKTGTIVGGTCNLAVLWEAPNGQLIAACLLGASSDARRYADMRTILCELPFDFPALAIAATPFTPAYLFTHLGHGGAWWDASDSAHLWQDLAGTMPVQADLDPVGRWCPKAGIPGLCWRQTAAAQRPRWRRAQGRLVFDGADDWLDLGSGGVGTTRLFAAHDDRFVVCQRLSGKSIAGSLTSKAGDRASGPTFESCSDPASGLGQTLRGSRHKVGAGLADSPAYSVHIWWNGQQGATDRDAAGSRQLVAGSAAEAPDQSVIFGARAGGTDGFFAGAVHHLVISDTYDRDAFRRLRDWFNGGTVNAFADAAGGRDAAADRHRPAAGQQRFAPAQARLARRLRAGRRLLAPLVAVAAGLWKRARAVLATGAGR